MAALMEAKERIQSGLVGPRVCGWNQSHPNWDEDGWKRRFVTIFFLQDRPDDRTGCSAQGLELHRGDLASSP